MVVVKLCNCIELCHKEVDIETSSLHVQYAIYMVVHVSLNL